MNVSFLTLWLSDFHTVLFFGSSKLFFVFKFVIILLLVLQRSEAYLPMSPSGLEAWSVIFNCTKKSHLKMSLNNLTINV